MTTRSAAFTVPLALELRSCREEDLPHLEWFGIFADHRAIIRGAFDAQAAGNGDMLLVAAAGFPVAQIWVDFERLAAERGAYLWALRVLPPFRRLGLARRLVRHAERIAAARDAVFTEIEADEMEHGVRRIYERLGYLVAARRHHTWTYRTPDDREVSTQQHLVALRRPLLSAQPVNGRQHRLPFAGPSAP